MYTPFYNYILIYHMSLSKLASYSWGMGSKSRRPHTTTTVKYLSPSVLLIGQFPQHL